MSFRRAEGQAKAWGSALYDLGAAGHINIASGFGPWPDAATLAQGLRGREARFSGSVSRQQGRWGFRHFDILADVERRRP